MNVSRFADKIIGIGGFINISQNAKKVVFSGTFTAGGLETDCVNGTLRIVTEGRFARFVKGIEQICYNATFAEEQGRTALFVTERAVLKAVDGILEVIEGAGAGFAFPSRTIYLAAEGRGALAAEAPEIPDPPKARG